MVQYFLSMVAGQLTIIQGRLCLTVKGFLL